MTRVGVLLMTFGAIDSLDEVPVYYTNIRGGHPPTAEQIEDLRQRYARIGGRSPLRDITARQAAALERRLRADGHDVRVAYGMKYWPPLIESALRDLVVRGVRRVVAFTSGPYDSKMSIGSYEKPLEAARTKIDPGLDVDLVRCWHDAPGLDDAWEEQIRATLRSRGWTSESTYIIFTAHALPERILSGGDPYTDQFFQHAQRLIARLNLPRWGLAYQSAGAILTERWLGPDILDALVHVKGLGGRRVLVAPIGFCADHLEILHDLDIEGVQRARELGLEFARTPSLNDSPLFVAALAAVVASRLGPGTRLPQAHPVGAARLVSEANRPAGT